MSGVIDAEAIAAELVEAYSTGTRLPRTLSSREGFSLQAAYAVEAALARRRSAAGRRVVGRKVAFAERGGVADAED